MYNDELVYEVAIWVFWSGILWNEKEALDEDYILLYWMVSYAWWRVSLVHIVLHAPRIQQMLRT